MTTFASEKQRINDERNKLKRCPYCTHGIEDQITTITRIMIKDLYRIYKWCGERRRHEFTLEELESQLRVARNTYSNLAAFTKKGGLLYRPIDPKTDEPYRKKFYGMNMSRARAFFRGEYPIPAQFKRHGISSEVLEATYARRLRQFPKLESLLDERGFYDPDRVLDIEIDWAVQEDKHIEPVTPRVSLLPSQPPFVSACHKAPIVDNKCTNCNRLAMKIQLSSVVMRPKGGENT